MRFFDFSVLNDQRIPLTTVAAEDGAAVKGEVESLCQGKGWVGDEADLTRLSDCKGMVGSWGEKLTLLLPDGSSVFAHAFMLLHGDDVLVERYCGSRIVRMF